MPFLKSLFRKNAPTPEERKNQATQLLQEAQEEALTDPAAALKLLRKKGCPFYALLSFNSELHSAFRKTVVICWSRTGQADIPPSGEVVTVPWDTWEAPTMQDLFKKCQEVDGDFLYLRPPEKERHQSALAELEGLRMLHSPTCAYVLFGEAELLIRRAFVQMAVEKIDPQSEDILQDLDDCRRDLDLEVGWVTT